MIRDKELRQNEKFETSNHAGPVDVVKFMGLTDEEEAERIKQDVYQKIHYLVKSLL